MIKLAQERFRPHQASFSLEECQIDFCSSACIFQNLPSSPQIVRHGSSKSGLAIVSGQELWLNISDETHPQDHPLYLLDQKVTISERYMLLERIKQVMPEHVVKILSLCHCGMVIEILDGLPFVDIGTSPLWHRKMYRSQHQRDALSKMRWAEFLAVMTDLGEGIQALHEQGVAHGDLFPFNAMVTTDNRGVWVDLNDVLPATSLAIALDIWTFINYTFMASLLRLKSWQPEVVRQIVEIVAEKKQEHILRTVVSDLKIANDQHNESEIPLNEQALAVLAEIYHQSGLQAREDDLGYVSQLLSFKGLIHFYGVFEWNARVARERERRLAAEQVRHTLVEREIQRTLSLRYQAQIEGQTAWITELEQGKAWLEEQWRNWQRIAEEREATIRQQEATIRRQDEYLTKLGLKSFIRLAIRLGFLRLNDEEG